MNKTKKDRRQIHKICTKTLWLPYVGHNKQKNKQRDKMEDQNRNP